MSAGSWAVLSKDVERYEAEDASPAFDRRLGPGAQEVVARLGHDRPVRQEGAAGTDPTCGATVALTLRQGRRMSPPLHRHDAGDQVLGDALAAETPFPAGQRW